VNHVLNQSNHKAAFRSQIWIEILAFFKALVFFQKYLALFSRKELGSGKKLSELHSPIHCKSSLMRVYEHAGCKEDCKDFTVVLKNWTYLIKSICTTV